MPPQVFGNSIPLVMDEFVRVPCKNHQSDSFSCRQSFRAKSMNFCTAWVLTVLLASLELRGCLDGTAAPCCTLIVVTCGDGIIAMVTLCLHAFMPEPFWLGRLQMQVCWYVRSQSLILRHFDRRFLLPWPKWRPEWSNLSQVEWRLLLVLHVFGLTGHCWASQM